jgi:hypothetical protein
VGVRYRPLLAALILLTRAGFGSSTWTSDAS